MNNSSPNKIITSITFCVLALIILILLMRTCNISDNYTESTEPRRIVEIKWQKGEVIRDTIILPTPVKTIVKDSLIIISTPIDTAALFNVWKDYYTERQYNLDFSNDSVGIVKINALVNENKLISATSLIQPNIRTVHEKELIYKKKKWVPWAMIGTSVDLKTNKVQFGVDLNRKYVIGFSGVRMDNRCSYTLDFGIKFK